MNRDYDALPHVLRAILVKRAPGSGAPGQVRAVPFLRQGATNAPERVAYVVD